MKGDMPYDLNKLVESLWIDNFRIKAELATVNELFISHLAKIEAAAGNTFDGDAYRKRMNEISSGVVHQLIMQDPVAAEYFAQKLKDDLNVGSSPSEGRNDNQ
jgi:hypothetical protein